MQRAHLITGGYPLGSSAAHDMDYARRELLSHLASHPGLTTTVSSEFADLEKWLGGAQMLVTYVAGLFPDPAENEVLSRWLERGGRWVALHGSSGGIAARIEGSPQRRMVKGPHHKTLGCFFLNHPPIRKFRVDVADSSHRLTQGLPASFEIIDELYLIELTGDCQVLLTTELPDDPSPPGFGFAYDEDTSLQSDGKTRVLGYSRAMGRGAVVYYALGHCHSAETNVQPFVDASVSADGSTPPQLRAAWESGPFRQIIGNGVAWGIAAR